MTKGNWTIEETRVALYLYCKLPFGSFHHKHPEIIEVAQRLDRSPSALSMKLCNLAAHDPTHRARNVKGLKNSSKLDRILIESYLESPIEMGAEAHAAYSALGFGNTADPGLAPDAAVADRTPSEGAPTEATASVKIRLAQGTFRVAVLGAYEGRCTFCALDLPELLVASHIIPWSHREDSRVDPRNGLALCRIHDGAFDCGLMGLDAEGRMLVSSQLRQHAEKDWCRSYFGRLHGEPMAQPHRFGPKPEYLAYHREKIFVA